MKKTELVCFSCRGRGYITDLEPYSYQNADGNDCMGFRETSFPCPHCKGDTKILSKSSDGEIVVTAQLIPDDMKK